MDKKAEKNKTLNELAEEVMEVVLNVASRRLVQSLQEVNDSRIEPLRKALKNCQTITPSLMDGEAAKERLREINSYVYDVLGTGRPLTEPLTDIQRSVRDGTFGVRSI